MISSIFAPDSRFSKTVQTATPAVSTSTSSPGELLKAAEQAGFDVLLTTDKNMASQQNLKNRRIAIVVLGNSQWRIVQRYVRRIAAIVNGATPGSYAEVEIPFR
jgi:hypothetical protein